MLFSHAVTCLHALVMLLTHDLVIQVRKMFKAIPKGSSIRKMECY